ncbi:MAG: VWA domain-containing protein, partial [Bryobacteraceae bacterium]
MQFARLHILLAAGLFGVGWTAPAGAQTQTPPAGQSANPAPAQGAPQNPAEAAQKTPPAAPVRPPGAFNTSVSEVIVPVTVTDDKGKFVTNLDQRDFQLFDNGKPQNITYFTRERNQPVVIGFLVDLSNTNRLQWDKLREAIEALISATLEPETKPDKRFSGYLIGYGSE